jgi:hypothetical protein
MSEMLPLVERVPLGPADAQVKLAEHAEVIRTLGKRVVGDVVVV